MPHESYRRRPGMKNHNSWIFKNDKIGINYSAFVYIIFAVNLLLISDDKTQSKLWTDRIVKYGVLLWRNRLMQYHPTQPKKSLKMEPIELDFFLPPIDAASSFIDRRFNVECLSSRVCQFWSTSCRWWPEMKTLTWLLDNYAVLQSWTGIYVLQKGTCCSTVLQWGIQIRW